MRKIKVFAKDGLDGINSAVVMKSVLERHGIKIDAKLLTYETINNELDTFILEREYKEYDKVYILGLSVWRETAQLIDGSDMDLELIDMTSEFEHLKEYMWVNILPEDMSVTKYISTMLLPKYASNIPMRNKINELVSHINNYVIWKWKDVGDIEAVKYVELLDMKNNHSYIDNMVSKIVKDKPLITEHEYMAIKSLMAVKSYLSSKKARTGKKTSIFGVDNVLLVFADFYSTYISNSLLVNRPDVDMVIVVDLDLKKYIIKSRNTSNKSALEVATSLGGGGKKNRAGAKITYSSLKEIFEKIGRGEAREF